MLAKRKDLQQDNKNLFIFLCIKKLWEPWSLMLDWTSLLKNVTKLKHCWKAWNKQLSFKLGWALRGCTNLPKNVHSNATHFQHMHFVSYLTSFFSCMYPFFPLNLNLVKCLQNKKKEPKKTTKKKKASN